jgi:hypothetical protein
MGDRMKVMADYDCYPIWSSDEDGYRNLDPMELAISFELQEQLLEWSQRYDSILDREDPQRSGFATGAEETSFDIQGRSLAVALRAELGEPIAYFSLISRQLEDV